MRIIRNLSDWLSSQTCDLWDSGYLRRRRGPVNGVHYLPEIRHVQALADPAVLKTLCHRKPPFVVDDKSLVTT